MSSDAVQDAVGRYLEYAELGGVPPDFSDLPPQLRSEVEEIIGLLRQTEGVQLRTADPQGEAAEESRRRSPGHLAEAAGSEAERATLLEMASWLPPGTPVDADGAPYGFTLADLPVSGAWTVGTSGGRVRVWNVDVPGAAELEDDPSHLETLDRVFRAFPETAAICLCARDLTSLLLEPQDCAPGIDVPSGGMTPRRYRRPVQPLGEGLAAFLRELLPVWEALPRFEETSGRPVDVRALATEAANASVGAQRALGTRARYPKKEALATLGNREASALAGMAISLYEGSRTPEEVQEQLGKLAGP